ncbi:MAG: hypothetical protein K2L51_05655 [Clostridiales bacterium]|nr:hypothetical protein [Clostridiales bacterium]
MNNLLTLQKAERLAKTKGIKGWAAMLALLGTMCFDQFVLEIPFANVVFPILIICAASMNIAKNFVLVTVYSVLFELSCIAWFPADLVHVQWWLLEVWIGYSMPYLVYKLFNRKHENMRVVSYATLAALSELLYFWVSVVATILIWGVDPIAYMLSDLPYEALGCVATFVCALPVAALYKLSTGELALGRKRTAATQI